MWDELGHLGMLDMCIPPPYTREDSVVPYERLGLRVTSEILTISSKDACLIHKMGSRRARVASLHVLLWHLKTASSNVHARICPHVQTTHKACGAASQRV